MPLIKGVTADNYFLSVGAAREDEAVGMMTGAHMAGLRGAAMMQTSGFALVANAGQTPRDPALIRKPLHDWARHRPRRVLEG